MLHAFLQKKTHETFKNINVSQQKHPSLSKLNVCTIQDLGRNYGILQYVTLILDVYQVCHCVGFCVKKWKFFFKHEAKVSRQYFQDVLLSHQILMLLTRRF